MQHVTETPPSVLELRPEVPLRVANAVERALEKRPDERFPTMDAFVDELEACLVERGSEPDREATAIVRAPAKPAPRRQRPGARRPVWPLVLLVGGLAALVAVVAITLLTDTNLPQEVRERAPGGDGGAAAARPISLSGVGAFDPFGDNREEHDDEAPSATDRNAETFWTTESYDAGLQKEGVGLVLDAGRAVELAELTVKTATPGYTAEIRAGSNPDGPFDAVVGKSAEATETTTWKLEGDAARYYVLWITELENRVQITEVTGKA